MICFQTLFFLILVTTPTGKHSIRFSCDLLSNFVLSNFGNNAGNNIVEGGNVVICFQTLFFLILLTTKARTTIQLGKL